jgi:hypothetical protein
MTQPPFEISVEVENNIFEVTVEIGPEILAEIYAKQAKESADLARLDAIATAADRIQTGLDAQATAADRLQTGLDVQQTQADRIQTGLDVQAAAADRIQTGLDVNTTNANVVTSTNLRDQTNGFRLVAQNAATTATEQAGIATSKAQEVVDAEIRINDAETRIEGIEQNVILLEAQSQQAANTAIQSNTDTQALLANFFDPAIIALNSRIVADGAEVIIKLRFVQQELDLLTA